MPYRKKTLRKLPNVTRRLGKLTNDLHALYRRLGNLLPLVERLEHDSKALFKQQQFRQQEQDRKEMDDELRMPTL